MQKKRTGRKVLKKIINNVLGFVLCVILGLVMGMLMRLVPVDSGPLTANKIGIFLIFIVVAYLVHMIIHEAGHLAAGLMSG